MFSKGLRWYTWDRLVRHGELGIVTKPKKRRTYEQIAGFPSLVTLNLVDLENLANLTSKKI